MSVTKQIKKIADNEGVKITNLEVQIGASKGVLSRAIKNGTDIQAKWVSRIVENFPQYNPKWILTGKGKMLLIEADLSTSLAEPSNEYTSTAEAKEAQQKVPLYDSVSINSLNSDSSSTDKSADTANGTISIPNIPPCDGAIIVTGNSMHPALNSGDIVMFKIVPEPLSAIYLYGEMYFISFIANMDEYNGPRWVKKGKDENHIIIESENKNHEPLEVHKSHIRLLALIKMTIRFN